MIEETLKELTAALERNTAALNKVIGAADVADKLTSEPAEYKTAPAKKQAKKTAIELVPDPAPAKRAEHFDPLDYAGGAISITSTPTAAPEPEPVKEEAPAAEPEPAPEPAVTGHTPTDIREYVKAYQTYVTAKGQNFAGALAKITALRDEYGAKNLNDIPLDKCGEFLAKVKAELPMD